MKDLRPTIFLVLTITKKGNQNKTKKNTHKKERRSKQSNKQNIIQEMQLPYQRKVNRSLLPR